MERDSVPPEVQLATAFHLIVSAVRRGADPARTRALLDRLADLAVHPGLPGELRGPVRELLVLWAGVARDVSRDAPCTPVPAETPLFPVVWTFH